MKTAAGWFVEGATKAEVEPTSEPVAAEVEGATETGVERASEPVAAEAEGATERALNL